MEEVEEVDVRRVEVGVEGVRMVLRGKTSLTIVVDVRGWLWVVLTEVTQDRNCQDASRRESTEIVSFEYCRVVSDGGCIESRTAIAGVEVESQRRSGNFDRF